MATLTTTSSRAAYGDLDDLLPRAEIDRIEDEIRREFRLPDDALLFAKRVPREAMSPPGDHDEGHFLIISPHPRELQRQHGVLHANLSRLRLCDYDDWVKKHGHYVDGRPDPAYLAFRSAAKMHMDNIASLKSIIN